MLGRLKSLFPHQKLLLLSSLVPDLVPGIKFCRTPGTLCDSYKVTEDGREGTEQAQGPAGTHWNQNTSSLPYFSCLDSKLEIQNKGSG